MTEQEQKAFDALREALGRIGDDINDWLVKGQTSPLHIDTVLKARAALTAANAVQEKTE